MTVNDHQYVRVLPSDLGKIRIFPFLVQPEVFTRTPGQDSVFVTLGAGETHISVLDANGLWSRGWTAIFGWSILCNLPFNLDGCQLTLEEETAVAEALKGKLLAYGRQLDTSNFVRDAKQAIRAGVSEILDRTIGSGISYDAIILCGPEWTRDLLSECCSLRPHILRDIKTS